LKDHSLEWAKIAEDDLGTAQYCFEGRRFLWALFMCQQAIEKILKAIYTKNTGEIPPKKHDLIALAGIAEILKDCSKDKRDLFRRLSRFYIKARYPESKEELESKATPEITSDILTKTKETFEWLKSILNQ